MINYMNGDATQPTVPGPKIIAHVCNDIGGWGRGFVLSVSKAYPEAEKAYRSWFQGNPEHASLPFQLNEVQLVKVADDVHVANMIAQHGIFTKNGVPPIRYDALKRCLQNVRVCATVLGASVHMPRIGCGLAGGEWNKIVPIIDENLKGVSVFVYDFTSNDARTIPWKQ
jgi:O-acetyl-ADP-ribose deacetylase (regulator of RNase III)